MREVAINLTSRGWEVLIDGIPSPRFDRYRRALKRCAGVIGAIVNTFVISPAKVMALVAALHLLTGFLQIQVTAADNYRRLQVQVDVGPTRPTVSSLCENGPAGTTKGQAACDRGGTAASAEARDVLNIVLVCYVFGVWMAAERWLKRRWPDRLRGD